MVTDPVLPHEKPIRTHEPLPGQVFLKHLTIASGLLAVGVSLAAILTARAGIALVGGAIPGNKTIALSAALIWIVLGTVLAQRAAKPFGRMSGLAVQAILVLIAVFGAVEFLYGMWGSYFFIENFFVRTGVAILGPSSSLISPVATGLAVPAALALALVIRVDKRSANEKGMRNAVSLLGLVISFVSITFVLSYVYDNPLLYGTPIIPIAFMSALAAFFVGASLVAAAGPGAVPVRYVIGNSTSARLLRVFVPLVAVLILSQNFIFVGLSSWFGVRDAVLLSAIFIVFLLATGFIVARMSGGLGTALDEAEQALVRKNEDLNALNEELTATQEELRQTNDELVVHEHRLVERNEDLNAINEELTATQEELHQTIDELTRADTNLRASEARLRRFYDSGLLGVFYWNMDGIITDANDKFLAMVGYTREELVTGRIDWINMTPPEFRHLDELSVQELGDTGANAQPFEKEYIRKDGKRIPIMIAGAMLDDARFDGVAFVMDITERKRAEEELRGTLDRFYLILSGMRHAILLVTADGRAEFANQAFCDFFGLSEDPGELSGKAAGEILDLIRPAYADPDASLARIGEIVRKGEPVQGEEVPMSNGRSFLRDFMSIRVGGRLYGRLWVHVDITARKKAEEALRESEERFRVLVNGVVDYAIVALDTKGNILSWNEGATRMKGYRADEIIGKNFSVFYPPEDILRGKPEEELKIARSTGRVEAEGSRLRKDGSQFWANVIITSMKNDRGEVTGFSKIVRDLTERKKAENDLRKKNEDLNALNEEITATQEELHQNLEELALREESLSKALAEKEVLLSEIHHRVKNNLTAFISLLSLEGSIEETPAGRQLRQDLQNRARSMALVHETLYRTHLYNDVDMEMYLTTLLDQIGISFQTTITVKTVIDAHGVMLDIPRATPAGLIINELVTNSYKYAFPEPFDAQAVRNTPPTIGITLTRTDGTYELIVRDNGIGLPPGFELAKTKTLGLKLVNFLAKHQMRATIEVNTNNGTEFIFRFKE